MSGTFCKFCAVCDRPRLQRDTFFSVESAIFIGRDCNGQDCKIGRDCNPVRQGLLPGIPSHSSALVEPQPLGSPHHSTSINEEPGAVCTWTVSLILYHPIAVIIHCSPQESSHHLTINREEPGTMYIYLIGFVLSSLPTLRTMKIQCPLCTMMKM